jgi:hypothetical protein
MFSHLNPDVLVTQSSYEPGYNRNPEVFYVVTERRINPFSKVEVVAAISHGLVCWKKEQVLLFRCDGDYEYEYCNGKCRSDEGN